MNTLRRSSDTAYNVLMLRRNIALSKGLVIILKYCHKIITGRDAGE
jgi:hypothetical protein